MRESHQGVEPRADLGIWSVCCLGNHTLTIPNLKQPTGTLTSPNLTAPNPEPLTDPPFPNLTLQPEGLRSTSSLDHLSRGLVHWSGNLAGSMDDGNPKRRELGTPYSAFQGY